MANKRRKLLSSVLVAHLFLGMEANDSNSCTLDPEGCNDKSVLMQSRLSLNKSLSPTASTAPEPSSMVEQGHAKKFTVECKFSLVEQDDDTDSGESMSYGMCEDDNEKVFYIRDDERSEGLQTGSKVRVTLEKTDAPQFAGSRLHVSGPWVSDKQPFYSVVRGNGVSLLASAAQLAAESRAKYGLTQEGVKKVGFLMVLLNYTKRGGGFHKLWFTNLPKWEVMTEELIWKGTYSKPEDWATDPVLSKLGCRHRLRGSFCDMFEKSSGGKVSCPESKGKVVTVHMGKNWEDETCNWKTIGSDAFRKAKEQFPGLDPNAYDFREIFMPHSMKKECKGTILTGWGFVRSGVALWGCGHPQYLPSPGACTAWYSGGDTFVRSHELGHNLGMLHNLQMWPDGRYRWLATDSWNGGSEAALDLPAPDRHQLGLLEDKAGEVLYWRKKNVAPVTVSSISRSAQETGAGFMAIRWPCLSGSGYLFLTFRGNTGYSAYNINKKAWNSVYIHYQKKYSNKRYGPGTEMRMKFKIDTPAYTPRDSPYSVHLCALGTDVVTVSLGATPSEAKQRCSQAVANVFYTTTTTTTTVPTLAPGLFKKLEGMTCGWGRARGSPKCPRWSAKLMIGKRGYASSTIKAKKAEMAKAAAKAAKAKAAKAKGGLIETATASNGRGMKGRGGKGRGGKGVRMQRWDGPVSHDWAEYICGTVCLRSPKCKGFMYDKRRGRCFYRRKTDCAVKRHSAKVCYQRQ